MRLEIKTIGFTLALILAASMAMAGSGSKDEKHGSMTTGGEKQGYVKLDVSVVDDLGDAAYLHFSTAREQFVLGNYDAAAAEYRVGAALVRLQAAKTRGEARRELEKNAGRLEDLADSIEKETVKDVKQLDREVSRAYWSLVDYHYFEAAERWADEREDEAEMELRAARRDLERSLAFAEDEVEKSYKVMIANADATIEMMEEEAEETREEIEDDLESFQFDPTAIESITIPR